MNRPNRILDYSSPAAEQTRERQMEEERRKKIEAYNEATFGERRPIAWAFLRLAVFIVVTSLIVVCLPRRVATPLYWLAIIGFFVWQIRREGLPSGRSRLWPRNWW